MYGIAIKQPWAFILVFLLMDFVFVYWLGWQDFYAGLYTAPIVVMLWIVAIFNPYMRYDPSVAKRLEEAEAELERYKKELFDAQCHLGDCIEELDPETFQRLRTIWTEAEQEVKKL